MLSGCVGGYTRNKKSERADGSSRRDLPFRGWDNNITAVPCSSAWHGISLLCPLIGAASV